MRAARTGPGQLLALGAHLDQNAGRITELEGEVRTLRARQGVQLLDPSRVAPSRWANRDPRHFEGVQFEAFVAEIRSSGGNVQPIKVRPVKGRADADYEIAFGHRRHRACLVAGLPVRAEVVELDDRVLFAEMDRENREREDLSPWEQGMMYCRALDEDLFPSLRQMAEQLGVDAGNASRAIALARLPQAVVAAFASPFDLQFRFAGTLGKALQKDPEAVLSRAGQLAKLDPKPDAGEVFRRLLSEPKAASRARIEKIRRAGKEVATLTRSASRTLIEFPKGALSEGQFEELKTYLEKLMKSGA